MRWRCCRPRATGVAMSYLLEALGRGVLADLRAAFSRQLPGADRDSTERRRERCAASPNSFDLAMRLGMALLREGQLADCRPVFERACELEPRSAQPRLALACAYDELGQLSRALEHLTAARELDASDPAIPFGIGFCHERLGHTAEAHTA